MKALITGITGQDGSYLAELLLSKGYEVYGLVRKVSRPNVANIENILDQVRLLDGDLLDQSSLDSALQVCKPDEIYNLAAQTHAGVSFNQPILTGEVTGLGAVRMLQAVKHHVPWARFYQASSSEMFGRVDIEPQNETTPFHPRSPYGAAKVWAHHVAVNYREAYGMHVSTGILFNHESPRRGVEFVTRKISYNVARIHHELCDGFKLGNILAKRDWGYAPEYADLMWRILQQDESGDFVGATGESHSVQDFLDEAFKLVGIEDWSQYVGHDASLERPAEVYNLRGDTMKAESELGWKAKTHFKDLVRLMMDADLDILENR